MRGRDRQKNGPQAIRAPVRLGPFGVTLARGCRAKGPGIRIRDSSRAPDTRAGMTVNVREVPYSGFKL